MKSDLAEGHKQMTVDEVMAIWLAHSWKVPVKDLPLGSDPSDPPMSTKGFDDAWAVMMTLPRPDIVFASTRQRCRDMATVASRIWLDAPILYLETLGQPDNFDVDTQIYGKESTPAEWVRWAQESHKIVTETCRGLRKGSALVLTHRPIIAALSMVIEDPVAALANPRKFVVPGDPRFTKPFVVRSYRRIEMGPLGD